MTTPTDVSKTVVPISEADRKIALTFARQQPTREKAEQVYLNTLAVLATKYCLDRLEIATDLEASDSWNPFMRLAANIADLKLANGGNLECCPVRDREQICHIPPEVLENRIGYVCARIDQPDREATILGFIPSVIGTSLPLDCLQPLEALLIHLEGITSQSQPIVHLRQWFDKITDAIDGTWQTVEMLGRNESAIAFRFRTFGAIEDNQENIKKLVKKLLANQRFDSLPLDGTDLQSEPDFQAALAQLIQTTSDEETRWKAAEILWSIEPNHPATGVRRVMDLGLFLAGQQIALMVAVLQSGDRRLSILTRVYPIGEERYLPSGLGLTVLTEDGSPGLETSARERDNYIQLKLRGEFGEQFGIQVRLNDGIITEYFTI